MDQGTPSCPNSIIECTDSEKISRILKRLKIVIEKRRISRGREVRLDFVKVNRKAKQLGITPQKLDEKQEDLLDVKEINEVNKNE